MDLIKHFWYLIHVERKKRQLFSADVTGDTIENDFASVIFRQFGMCFGLSDIAG